MPIISKNDVFYSKKDLETSKNTAVGFKKIKAMHEASAGDTLIDLNALTLPSITPGFVNPSAGDITAAKLVFNAKNLTIVSSLSGVLDFDSYTIPSNTTIRLKEPAEDKELFSITIDPVVKNGIKTVDVDPVVVTGTLSASASEFNVGTPFDVNKYNTQQQGSIMVFLDGQLMARNVANVTNAPAADGDYHEVDNGSGIGTLIRFNVTSTSARSIMVMSNGLAFSAPDDSIKAVVESLAGQVDAIIPTVAALAGTPEGNFQAAPNNIDLKLFGGKVNDLETGLAEGGVAANGPILATPTVSGAVKKNKFQTKIYNSSINSAGTLLTFNNIVIGNLYRVNYQIFGDLAATASATIYDGAVKIAFAAKPVAAFESGGGSVVFEATGTTVTMVWANGQIDGNGGLDNTWMQIEELDNIVETTNFT